MKRPFVEGRKEWHDSVEYAGALATIYESSHSSSPRMEALEQRVSERPNKIVMVSTPY